MRVGWGVVVVAAAAAVATTTQAVDTVKTKYSSSSGLMKGCAGRPDACVNEEESCEINKCNVWQHIGRDSSALLVFTAPWCPLCQDFEVQYSVLRNKYSPFKDVLVARTNGDENPNLMTDFGIVEYPSMLFFNRDCYWSDGGCYDQLQYWRYNASTYDADDIINFIDKAIFDRRIELKDKLIPLPDQGPCKGVTTGLVETGAPCALSPPDDGLNPTADSKLFGPSEPKQVSSTATAAPGGVWETILSKKRLEELKSAGQITEDEYKQKLAEISGDEHTAMSYDPSEIKAENTEAGEKSKKDTKMSQATRAVEAVVSGNAVMAPKLDTTKDEKGVHKAVYSETEAARRKAWTMSFGAGALVQDGAEVSMSQHKPCPVTERPAVAEVEASA